LHKSQLEPGILDRDCAHRRANCTQSRNLDASRVAYVLMPLTNSSKQFGLDTAEPKSLGTR
jgi:hypothetical protein